MNLEFFIAKRLLRGSEKTTVSVPIVRIALVGIALGVCVMLLSVFIINGFKKEITGKITGFSSHFNIISYGNSGYYGESKVRYNDTLYHILSSFKERKYTYGYITKPAILKSKEEIHGGVMYGVDTSYNGSFLQDNLTEGHFPDFHTEKISEEILISASVAKMLKVKAGDRIQAHFVQEPPRVRVLHIAGVFDTGFKEYDDVFTICDIRMLQRLNGWAPEEVSGIAMEIKDIKKIPQALTHLEELLPWGDEETEFYRVKTIYEMAPQIFDWLELLNMNVWIILILIITVAGFNMVSGLLILIIDKTTLIGMMKALGYKNIDLRKLFLYIAAGLIGKGMLWGNALAFLLGFIQYKFRLIHLDPATYYMDTVPLDFSWLPVILLNIGVLVISTLMLVIPTMLISRVKPIKAIRFE